MASEITSQHYALVPLKISRFTCILIGIALHQIGNIAASYSKNVAYAACLAGGLLVFYNLAYYLLKQRSTISTPAKILVLLYTIWNIQVLVHPFLVGENIDISNFSPVWQYGVFSFLLPFVCLAKITESDIRRIMTFCCLYGAIGLIILAVNYKDIFIQTGIYEFTNSEYQEYISKGGIASDFLLMSGFVILNGELASKKIWALSLFSVISGLVIQLYQARRTSVFMYLLYILGYFLFKFSLRINAKVIAKWLTAFAALVFAAFILSDKISVIVMRFMLRFYENSRVGVEKYLYLDFNRHPIDWYFGRGIQGGYYCPIFPDPYRNIIETGYLYLILKSGIIGLCLYLSVLGASVVYATVAPKSVYSKRLAYYIACHIIFLIPFGLPAFNADYFVMWASIAFCFQKSHRNISSYSQSQLSGG